MRFNTSDPDLDTLIKRVERGTIDLQPEFQRGEVWTTPKKQRLIDSILRRWHVPPIHLVAKGGGRFDVLDGQQRLTAIRDFMRGIFVVDGAIEPNEQWIRDLHGLRYQQLPEGVRDEFETFPIRVFELHDYMPEEPHELFFRLNQPTNLTEAEKRNAFIGGPRNQIRELVAWAEGVGMTQKRIGFSNSRMAYDDLLARFLLTLEQRSLSEKVTAQRITNRYRTKEPFSNGTIEVAQASLKFVMALQFMDITDARLKPNKATVHTWLCMAAELVARELLEVHGRDLSRTVEWIERSRLTRSVQSPSALTLPLRVFHDRATARVADASSVVLRDLTAWMVHVHLRDDFEVEPFSSSRTAWQTLDPEQLETSLSKFAQAKQWGEKGWV